MNAAKILGTALLVGLYGLVIAGCGDEGVGTVEDPDAEEQVGEPAAEADERITGAM